MLAKYKKFINSVGDIDIFVLCSGALFWVLRVSYWNNYSESPFSDLLLYVKTAENIINYFYFGASPAEPTFCTPVTPSIIAIAMLVNMQHYELIFRFIVQGVTFTGALWLVQELAQLTGKKWLCASFLFIVAICRPSIFWSLKLATEPVCEALLYLTAATALATLRTRSVSLGFVCGVTALLLGLNRPNFLPGTIFVPLAFALGAANGIARIDGKRQLFGRRQLPRPRTIPLLVVFFLGFFGTWGIWVGRNWINYGVFVPTSSSALQSFNWEYAGAPIRIGRYTALKLSDGSTFSNFGLTEIRTAPTPVERDKKLNMISKAWFAANWPELPRVFVWRLNHLVANRGANGLTKLSREDLFASSLSSKFNYPSPQTSWINLLLLDKTPIMCFIALIGLGLFFYSFRAAGAVFVGLAFMPWVAGALVLGYERIVESSIAMTLWFALFGVAAAVSWLNKSDGVADKPCASSTTGRR